MRGSAPKSPFAIGVFVSGKLEPANRPKRFTRHKTDDGYDRILVGGELEVFTAAADIAEFFTPPLWFHYELGTRCGDVSEGTYICTEQPTLAEIQSWLTDLDFWGASGFHGCAFGGSGEIHRELVVIDEERFLYIYGHLTQAGEALLKLGFTEGEVTRLGKHLHCNSPRAHEALKTFLGQRQWKYEQAPKLSLFVRVWRWMSNTYYQVRPPKV